MGTPPDEQGLARVRAVRLEAHSRRVESARLERAELADALAARGDDLMELWRRRVAPKAESLPVLTHWMLKLDDALGNRSLVADILGYRGAPDDVLDLLVAEARSPLTHDERSRYATAVGEALSMIGATRRPEAFIDLAKDRSVAIDIRSMVLTALGALSDPISEQVVLDYLAETVSPPLVVRGALSAVRQRRLVSARDQVVRLTEHREAETRRHARRTLAVIDRAIAAGGERIAERKDFTLT